MSRINGDRNARLFWRTSALALAILVACTHAFAGQSKQTVEPDYTKGEKLEGKFNYPPPALSTRCIFTSMTAPPAGGWAAPGMTGARCRTRGRASPLLDGAHPRGERERGGPLVITSAWAGSSPCRRGNPGRAGQLSRSCSGRPSLQLMSDVRDLPPLRAGA